MIELTELFMGSYLGWVDLLVIIKSMHILAVVDEVSFERLLLHLDLDWVIAGGLRLALLLLFAFFLVVELFEHQVADVLGLLSFELLLAFDPLYPVDLDIRIRWYLV